MILYAPVAAAARCSQAGRSYTQSAPSAQQHFHLQICTHAHLQGRVVDGELQACSNMKAMDKMVMRHLDSTIDKVSLIGASP